MFILTSILIAGITIIKSDHNVNFEPGHIKQDFESIEEVRGHENETTTEEIVEDESFIKEAILDVGYYLRRFKFNGFDVRFYKEEEVPKRNFYERFPSPPLKNIHWEVKRNCEESFVECVKYLQEKVIQTPLPRHLDSLTITKTNGWSFITDENLIRDANNECLILLKEEEKNFVPFYGPLQKFQWLTSANYYMCFYTMKGINYLKFFAEDCDNFASCIELEFGENNGDPRGNNNFPFACAIYSFCPDPCCPLKHMKSTADCVSVGPCSKTSKTDQSCSFKNSENTDFNSIILNRWNITCPCNEFGTRWESKSGMCIDVDECTELESPCDFSSETCQNLPGTFTCNCNPLGFRKVLKTNECVKDSVMQQILYPLHNSNPNESLSIVSKVFGKINPLKWPIRKNKMNTTILN